MKQRLKNVASSGEKTVEHDFNKATGMTSTGADLEVERLLISKETSETVTGEEKTERLRGGEESGGRGIQTIPVRLVAIVERILGNLSLK